MAGSVFRRLPGAVKRGAYEAYLRAWFSLTSRWPVGTNVFEREWDALILLDTCRVDALREVAPAYDFVHDVDSLVSVGSTSSEWIANTFRERYRDEIGRTGYVSANAFSKRVIEDREFPIASRLANWTTVGADAFQLLDQAWQHQSAHPYKHMLPEDLTDRTIALAREHEPERLIVHYSQPHKPYIANAMAESRELHDYEREPFDALKTGRVDYGTVWESYLENLRLVLDSVERLLSNLDAERAVLSSDHGESFGEYGGLIYGHPRGVLHPYVKRVPWAETTATDRGDVVPDVSITAPDESKATEEHLRDLGYR